MLTAGKVAQSDLSSSVGAKANGQDKSKQSTWTGWWLEGSPGEPRLWAEGTIAPQNVGRLVNQGIPGGGQIGNQMDPYHLPHHHRHQASVRSRAGGQKFAHFSSKGKSWKV